MTASITLEESEIVELTGYRLATKQLHVLHRRGFHRAYICRTGRVVLERSHYEAVTRGTYGTSDAPKKTANLDFMREGNNRLSQS